MELRNFWKILIILASSLLIAFSSYGQEEEESFEYTFKFKTVKNEDYSRSLIAELYGALGRDQYPVYEATIKFYNVQDTLQVALGEAITNKEGVAELKMESSTAFLKDEDGYMTFLAVFEGSDGIDAFEEELSVIDLNLSMELIEEDGVRSIMTYANLVNAAGEEEPIEYTDLYYYVQGMINRLKIEDGWLEYGEYEFEFPTDLPGDMDGNLKIYARVEDSDEYGTVVISTSAQWGVGPTTSSSRTPKLWTELGPEWMIAVLTVLLIGVWANLIHAIYNLMKIKKEGETA